MSEHAESHQTEPKDLIHQRNHLTGLWAAELLGLIGHAAHDYAQHVAHDLEAHGEDAEKAAARLARDLSGRAGIPEIREKMAHFLNEARHLLHKTKH